MGSDVAIVKKTSPVWIYYLLLTSVIVVWGMDPIVMSYLYGSYSATALAALGALVSALFFLAVSRKKLRLIDRHYLKIAVPISLITSVAALLQRIGLQYTTPANFAFLEHISCVVVPPAMFILARNRPRFYQVAASVVCLAGCFILSGVYREGGFAEFGIGKRLCLMSGILYGVSTAATGVFAKGLDIKLYMALHMVIYFFVSVLSAILLAVIKVDGAPMERFTFSTEPKTLIATVVFGFLSIGLGWLLRTEALRHLDPSLVGVTMPLAAVITGVVSVALSIEDVTPGLAIGGALVLAAVCMSGYFGAKEKKRKK